MSITYFKLYYKNKDTYFPTKKGLRNKGTEIPVSRNKSYEDIVPALMLVRKLSTDVVFNMSNLEGNLFTYPEVLTLMKKEYVHTKI